MNKGQNKMRSIMEKNGMSLVNVAKILNMDKSRLSRMLSGKKNKGSITRPTLREAVLMQKMFGVKAEDWLKDCDPPGSDPAGH